MQILRMHNNELTGPIPWQLGEPDGPVHNTRVWQRPGRLRAAGPGECGQQRLPHPGSVLLHPVGAGVHSDGSGRDSDRRTFTISWTAVTEAYKYGVEYRIESYGEEWLGLPTTDELQPRSYMWRDPLSIIDTSGRISINMIITCVSPSLMGA